VVVGLQGGPVDDYWVEAESRLGFHLVGPSVFLVLTAVVPINQLIFLRFLSVAG
jgi:hypothetical protein